MLRIIRLKDRILFSSKYSRQSVTLEEIEKLEGEIFLLFFSKICECSIPNVIYQLTCKLCTHNNSIYIGETSKTAYKRLVEHWLATCNKNVNLSSIAEHFNLYHNSHILSKDKPLLSLKIIDRANNYKERKIKEAVWINKLKPTLNKYTGLELTY